MAETNDELKMINHLLDVEKDANGIVAVAMEEAGIKTKMNTTVQSINAENGKVKSVTFVNKSSGETYTEEFDGVFIFVGNIPQTQLVPDCEKDEAGFIKTDRNMMTSIPGIYAIGDVRDTPFRQVVTAALILAGKLIKGFLILSKISKPVIKSTISKNLLLNKT